MIRGTLIPVIPWPITGGGAPPLCGDGPGDARCPIHVFVPVMTEAPTKTLRLKKLVSVHLRHSPPLSPPKTWDQAPFLRDKALEHSEQRITAMALDLEGYTNEVHRSDASERVR